MSTVHWGGMGMQCFYSDWPDIPHFVFPKPFSSLKYIKIFSGTHQPPTEWLPGTLPPVVKRPQREADQSPPSITEVKKECSCTSIPTVCLHEGTGRMLFNP